MPARASAAGELGAHEPHAFEQRVVRLRRLERAVEVVERRQQLLRERGRAALLRGGGLARDALAVVLEVRLRALREREVLVALRGHLHELVEVARELGGAVGLPARGRRRSARGPRLRRRADAPGGVSQPRPERAARAR